MISRVADYEMVDVTGLERFVKGKILPVREGGAKRALKYEDMLLLKEGKLERQNWTLAANTAAKANKAAAPSRWLRKDVFESAVCSGTWSDYRDAEKEITEGLKNDGPIEDIVGDVVALGNYEAGRTLKLERLEKAYENMGKLKRTMEGIVLNSWQMTTRGKHRDPRTGEITTDPEGSYSTRTKLYDNAGSETGGVKTSEFTETCQEGSTLLFEQAYPYANKAWMIARIYTDVEGSEYQEWMVKACEVTQLHEVRLQLNLGAIANEIFESHGGHYVEVPDFTGTWGDVEMQRIYLLVEHDFPASEPEVG